MDTKGSLNVFAVSVCISVHNTAKYLRRCLDSVLAQTLQSIEIVLVNNGSTDNSEEIMREYAAQNPKVKFVIVSQEDRGLAQGRQSGIDNASGEFIAFLDADDLVCPSAYKKLYDLAVSTGSDIAEMQTKRDEKIISSPFSGIVDAKTILETYFSASAYVPQMLWLRIYRKSLFKKPVLPKIYVNNEDNFAFPCLLLMANQVAYLKEPLHIYSTDNENAVMNLLGKPSKEHMDRYIERKKRAIKSVPYVIDFFGEKRHDYEFFDAYIASNIVEFLADNTYYLNVNDKVDYLVKIFKVDSFKILSDIISKHLLPKNMLYIAARILGAQLACKIYCKIKY